MEPYLRAAGLWYAAQITLYEYDNALISAFVERWRPETHTFHLPYGECTITLQDVAFQLGLRVDGRAVSGCTGGWERFHGCSIWTMCEQFLGAVPDEGERDGCSVDLSWFHRTFGDLRADAPQETVIRHTRAYILQLLGGFLMADKSGSRVHLRWLPIIHDFEYCGSHSWGSAVLAVLYRNLCRAVNSRVVDIAGCLALVQSWIWHRVPELSPAAELTFPLAARWGDFRCTTDRHRRRLETFRMQIDALSIEGFRWTPYDTDAGIAQIAPDFVYRDAPLWPSVTSLICFGVIEFHQVDRVLRQFGGQQPIPGEPLNLDRLHGRDARGSAGTWWPDRYRTYHDFWDARVDQVVRYQLATDSRPSAAYMRWYTDIARRFLSADRVLGDPRSVQMPRDVPDHVAPVPAVSQPAHAPDRRRRERRARVGTRTSRRRVPRDVDDDDDDADAADPCHDIGDDGDDDDTAGQTHSSSIDPSSQQQLPSSSFGFHGDTAGPTIQTFGVPRHHDMPSSHIMAGPSHQFELGSSSQFVSSPPQEFVSDADLHAMTAEILALLDEDAATDVTPAHQQLDHRAPSECYRPVLDVIDLNASPHTPSTCTDPPQSSSRHDPG